VDRHELGHDVLEVCQDLDFREHLGVLIYGHGFVRRCRI
jgi:hypothetical protein